MFNIEKLKSYNFGTVPKIKTLLRKEPQMKYVVYLVIDQLAGHWAGSVRVDGTDFPPANVKGYHEKGLIPNFSYLIDNGLWVK
ncbi:hypothetical protein DRQ11_12135, partial [candidate division KSB1 bacterium]